MYHDGQLSLEDFEGYQDSKSSLKAIESGDLQAAYTYLEKLAEQSVDEERFFDSMKAVKFWMMRLDTIAHTPMGMQRAGLLESEWSRFEDFLLRYSIHAPEVVSALRKFFFLRIIDCYSFALEKQNYKNIERLLSLVQELLFMGEAENALKTLHFAKKLSPKEIFIDLLMADTLALLKKPLEASRMFKKTFLLSSKEGMAEIRCAEICRLQYFLYALGFRGDEILTWLPLYALVYNLFPVESSDDSFSLASCFSLIQERKEAFQRYQQSSPDTLAKLLYAIFYCLDMIEYHFQKKKQASPDFLQQQDTTLKKHEMELKKKARGLLENIEQLSSFFYSSARQRYESFT